MMTGDDERRPARKVHELRNGLSTAGLQRRAKTSSTGKLAGVGATRSSVLNLKALDNHPGCRQCRGSAGLATARGWEGAGAAVGHGDWCGSSRGKERQNLSNVKVLR
ncbi:hypothetical protein NL676_019340 [Syzygium grande]|nr:hypothetical protein NL676_019340 [Syzygium grande]